MQSHQWFVVKPELSDPNNYSNAKISSLMVGLRTRPFLCFCRHDIGWAFRIFLWVYLGLSEFKEGDVVNKMIKNIEFLTASVFLSFHKKDGNSRFLAGVHAAGWN
jgi:hypothetical protein